MYISGNFDSHLENISYFGGGGHNFLTKHRQNSGKIFWSGIMAILTSILTGGHLTRKMDATGYPVVTGKFTMSSARGTLNITFVNREKPLFDTLILMIYFDVRTFRFEKIDS